MTYNEIYADWQADPDGFWMRVADAIDWIEPPSKALFAENAPFFEWFSDAKVNTCYNAVDRHVVAGHGDRIALIYDSAMTGDKVKTTYSELQNKVARLGGALQEKGIDKGDRVIIYMPMVTEAVVAMLACSRIGAIHSVVFGGFAADELATRIDDATPKAILMGSCGLEPGKVVAYKPLVDKAIAIATHKPDFCVVFQRDTAKADLVIGRDHDWEEFQKNAPLADCVPVMGSDPVYILYTSGTTGKPKGVIRPTAGHLVALQWSMKNVYDINPGEVFWAASDVGWVVGHSYICYAPLIQGSTSVIYEGKPVGTPDAGAFWRVIEEHKVKALFTAPTAFRAIKRADPEGELLKNYDLSCFETLFLAGERADPDTIHWAERKLEKPVIDHWWQTETGWAMAANPIGIEHLPVKAGSPTVPMPGYDIHILDEAGKQLPPNELGAIAVKLPLPPGSLPTLWNADGRYLSAYLTTFDGYYETGDAGYVDEDGYLYIMSRTDDVINVAGHRLSTGAMEDVLAGHPDVAECAVIGRSDSLKGQLPLGFLCLKAGVNRPNHEVIKECVDLVRSKIGPVAAFKLAVVVERLPKTRSGKILRGTMAKIADGMDWKMPAAIDEPCVLLEIQSALEALR